MAEQDTNGGYANRWKFNGKELDTDTGLYYYEARYYDPSASIWMSVDPLVEKYSAWSPYNYVMNNPVNLIDPTGMGPSWKPILNRNGSTTYVAEQGDSVDSFATQYGISREQSLKLIGTEKVVANNTSVSGQSVYNLNPYGGKRSEVLKLDLQKAHKTPQKVIDQFIFATQHSKTKGAYAWAASTYFSKVFKMPQMQFDYVGEICIDNIPVDIQMSVFWNTSRGAYINETRHQSVFGNTKKGSDLYTSGSMFGTTENLSHLKFDHGYLFPEGLIWQNRGYQSLLTQSKNNSLLNEYIFKEFPSYNYINTSQKSNF